jgi:hypothetical protein
MQLSKKELGTFLDPDFQKKKLCKSICGRDVRIFFWAETQITVPVRTRLRKRT